MEQFFGTMQEQYPVLETLLIIAIVMLITWIVEHCIFKVLSHMGKRKNDPLPSSSIFANIARICIWFLGVATALKICFNVDITAFVAAMGVGGIAISLGFQDTLLNLIGGLQVSMGRLVEPGQYIQVLNQCGRVTDISWRHTTILDSDGKTHMIPNSLMNKNSLVDIGSTGEVQVPFLIPVSTDVHDFTRDVEDALLKSLDGQLGPRGIKVQFDGQIYGGLSGNVVADIIRTQMDASTARDKISRAIDPVLKAVSKNAE